MLTSIIIRKPEDVMPAMQLLGKRILGFWDFAAHPLEVEYKPAVDRRSLSQNAHFWALCEDLASHFTKRGTLLTKEEAHDLMCYKFLGTKDKIIGKTVIPQQMRRTSDLDKGEMSQLITEIIDWALDHGVKIRNPHDSEFMQARREAHA